MVKAMRQRLNPVLAVQQLLLGCVRTADVLVDATAGNGKDTLFLAQNSPADAHIYSFDIQETALVNTAAQLQRHGLEHKVRLVHDSHAVLFQYLSVPIDAAVFNLGYLPGGDKSVTTCSDSTLAAVEQVLDLLKPGGRLGIVAYPGHCEGRRENQLLHDYLCALPAAAVSVFCTKMINHGGNVPVGYIVEKIRGIG